MKKIKLLFSVTVISLVFAACSSSGLANLTPDVNAFDILDQDSLMYISLPVPDNKELSKTFIDAVYPNLKDSEKEQLITSLNRVYLGFGTEADKTKIQLSGEITKPSLVRVMASSNTSSSDYYIQKIADKYDSISGLMPSGYKIYDVGGTQLSFPSNKIVAVSKDVKPMVNNYYNELIAGFKLLNSSEGESQWKNSDIHQWICQNSSGLVFYIRNPQSFMANLLANDYSNKIFKLNYCKGTFIKLDNGKYSLSVTLDFTDSSLTRLAIPVIRLALGLTDFKITQNSNANITISEVQVTVRELMRILGK